MSIFTSCMNCEALKYCRFALKIYLIMTAEFGFTFADSKNIQEIIAKSIAVLFIFSIANGIAILFFTKYYYFNILLVLLITLVYWEFTWFMWWLSNSAKMSAVVHTHCRHLVLLVSKTWWYFFFVWRTGDWLSLGNQSLSWWIQLDVVGCNPGTSHCGSPLLLSAGFQMNLSCLVPKLSGSPSVFFLHLSHNQQCQNTQGNWNDKCNKLPDGVL